MNEIIMNFRKKVKSALTSDTKSHVSQKHLNQLCQIMILACNENLLWKTIDAVYIVNIMIQFLNIPGEQAQFWVKYQTDQKLVEEYIQKEVECLKNIIGDVGDIETEVLKIIKQFYLVIQGHTQICSH